MRVHFPDPLRSCSFDDGHRCRIWKGREGPPKTIQEWMDGRLTEDSAQDESTLRKLRPSATRTLARRIVEHVKVERMAAGAHLKSSEIARVLSVSRFPVGQAFDILSSQGILRHEKNRGYFTAENWDKIDAPHEQTGPEQPDATYFRIAEDRLKGRLPDHVTEAFLQNRYGVPRKQLKLILNRITAEGWINPRTGYGWVFSPMLTTPKALDQTYRVRLAIEPAALLEEDYSLAPSEAERCRNVEIALLNGRIETASPSELYEAGVRFHETLVAASNNPFFLDALRRINMIRRLLSYQLMFQRQRYYQQAEEHLRILELVERGNRDEAADAMRRHLLHVIENIGQITKPQ